MVRFLFKVSSWLTLYAVPLRRLLPASRVFHALVSDLHYASQLPRSSTARMPLLRSTLSIIARLLELPTAQQALLDAGLNSWLNLPSNSSTRSQSPTTRDPLEFAYQAVREAEEAPESNLALLQAAIQDAGYDFHAALLDPSQLGRQRRQEQRERELQQAAGYEVESDVGEDGQWRQVAVGGGLDPVDGALIEAIVDTSGEAVMNGDGGLAGIAVELLADLTRERAEEEREGLNASIQQQEEDDDDVPELLDADTTDTSNEENNGDE